MGTDELERNCANCSHSFPSEPFGSEFGVCLRDPDFEPYLDDLLGRNDFSRCQALVKRKRYPWDREACRDFEPAEIVEDCEFPPELAETIGQLVKEKQLTAETLEQAFLAHAFSKIDWATVPVDQYVERLHNAQTPKQYETAVQGLGALIANDNKAAFDALCSHLENLEPPKTVAEVHSRILILSQLGNTRRFERKLARLLVKDLFRTPSSNTTRGYYAEIFRWFERLPADVAEDALLPMLDSPCFSYRIKKRIKGILRRTIDYGLF